MSRTWYVENTWTCASCQASNRGRNMNCEKCGAKKAPDAAEQMGSPDAEISDPEMLKQAAAGANWICEYCGGQERNLNGECKTCGGPKGLASDEPKDVKYVNLKRAGRVVVQNVRVSGDVSIVSSWDMPPDDLPRATLVNDEGDYNIRPSWGSLSGIKNWMFGNKTKVAVILLSVMLTAGTVWFFNWLFTPRFVNARVDSIHWQYTTRLRVRETKHDEEWGHPSSKGFYNEPAFNVSCESRYYGTEDCHPHDCRPHSVSYSCNCTSYECNCSNSCTNQKNGYSSCSKSCSTCSKCSTCYRVEYDTCYDSCPVYRDWCRYDYYDWPIAQTQSTSGDDHKVYWPGLATDGSFLQRLQKTEEYGVSFVCPEDKFDYKPKSLSDYHRFDVGDSWKLQVGKIRTHNIEEMTKITPEKL